MTVPLPYYLVLSAVLFVTGVAGVLTRRNAIVVFMCVELMLNASNLALVAFARQHGNLDGQIAAFFVSLIAFSGTRIRQDVDTTTRSRELSRTKGTIDTPPKIPVPVNPAPSSNGRMSSSFQGRSGTDCRWVSKPDGVRVIVRILNRTSSLSKS